MAITESKTTSPTTDIQPGQRWQHVKRGTSYEVLGCAELQTVTGDLPDGAALVVYRGDDGKLWAREEGEFSDGRFRLTFTTPTLGDMVPCAFVDCPPGLFRWQGLLCFKSEYSSKRGQQDAYCVDTGEYFWGGTDGDLEKRRALIVTPVSAAPASPIPTSVANEGEREKAQEVVRDALMDSQYLAGAKAGWNAAQADDPEAALAALLKSRDGHLTGFADAKRILALPPALDNTAVEGLTDEQYKRLGYKLTAPLSDWFIRNGDRTNPTAFINTDPAYFGMECGSFIAGIVRASTVQTEKA